MIKTSIHIIVLSAMSCCYIGCSDHTSGKPANIMNYSNEIEKYLCNKDQTKDSLFAVTIGNDPSPEQLKLFLLGNDKASRCIGALGETPAYRLERWESLFWNTLDRLAEHPDKVADKVLASLESEISWDAGASLTFIEAISRRGESCIKLLKSRSRREHAREVMRTGRI